MKNSLIPALLGFLICCGIPQRDYAASMPGTPALPREKQELIQRANKEFLGLSRKEKKSRIREVHNLLKGYKNHPSPLRDEEGDQTIILAILAILLPPLAVFLKENELTGRFWISLLLTLLFWIPGVVYALLVVFEII